MRTGRSRECDSVEHANPPQQTSCAGDSRAAAHAESVMPHRAQRAPRGRPRGRAAALGPRAQCSEAWPLASASRTSPRVARQARGACRVASRAIARRRAGTSAMSPSGVAPGPSSPRSASASSATAPACTRPASRKCRQTRRPWAASLGPRRTPCRVGQQCAPEAPAGARLAAAAAAAQAVARARMAALIGAGRCRRVEPPGGARRPPAAAAGSLYWCWATAGA